MFDEIALERFADKPQEAPLVQKQLQLQIVELELQIERLQIRHVEMLLAIKRMVRACELGSQACKYVHSVRLYTAVGRMLSSLISRFKP